MKSIGKEFQEGEERRNYIADNADSVEEKGYMKRFTDAEMEAKKTELAEVSIQINDFEEEKKAFVEQIKRKMKPLLDQKVELLEQIKHKAEYVKEDVYKFIDEEERMADYFNENGDLIESRPLNAKEAQKTIFMETRKTGTNN